MLAKPTVMVSVQDHRDRNGRADAGAVAGGVRRAPLSHRYLPWRAPRARCRSEDLAVNAAPNHQGPPKAPRI